MELKDKNLYYIGGVVRDEILGVESFDTDYCYVGNAIEFAQNNNLKILKENPAFGTVKVLFKGKEIDIASTREEDYPASGQLPVVKNIGCALLDDLKRRDFTINALAKNTLTGEIIDYFGGLEDLKNKKIKVLHKNSFIDDPSRIIRALKFSARFNFCLNEETELLQEKYLENINYAISWHRIKKEIKETFNLNKDFILKKFIDEKIYKLLNSNCEIPVIKASTQDYVNKYKPNNVWLVYAGLFNLENFELTTEEREIIQKFNEIKTIVPNNDYETYKLLENIPLESIIMYGASTNSEIATKYLDTLRNIKIETTGNDLKQVGIEQGKLYKEIFDFILVKKIYNPTLNKAQEIELVKGQFL